SAGRTHPGRPAAREAELGPPPEEVLLRLSASRRTVSAEPLVRQGTRREDRAHRRPEAGDPATRERRDQNGKEVRPEAAFSGLGPPVIASDKIYYVKYQIFHAGRACASARRNLDRLQLPLTRLLP